MILCFFFNNVRQSTLLACFLLVVAAAVAAVLPVIGFAQAVHRLEKSSPKQSAQ